LVTGDAEALSVKRALYDTMQRTGEKLSIDVFKPGHHGSKGSVDEELLSMVRPRQIVVSVGEENGYGHPAPSMLDLCNRYVDTVRRTDQHGSIIIGLTSVDVAQ
jgi:competence protein ComEC